MSTHEVVRLMRDLHRKGLFDEFDADRPAFLSRYQFTDDERSALVSNDLGALYAMGVHPMAVLFFSQDNHVTMPEYLSAIGANQERVDQLKGLFGEGARGAAGIVPSGTRADQSVSTKGEGSAT